MKLAKLETKKALGIFDVNYHDKILKDNIISCASEYWALVIKNSKEEQISFQMGNGLIHVSDKELEKFKKSFSSYISKRFPKDGSIMLWTSNGEYFDTIGVDAYLEAIMKHCNLPLTCLPSDLCMWISSKKIEIEHDFNHEIIFNNEKTK